MTPERFFDLFLEELRDLPELSSYYKYHASARGFEFRRAYFLQRLRYVDREVRHHANLLGRAPAIWDLGCGYGTTCLYLAMNGLATYGSTLEFYYGFLHRRRAYWSRYGDAELFAASYEDVYDAPPAPGSYDVAVVQDTLHHLEPIGRALGILRDALRPGGIAVCVEENGDNLVQTAKLYRQRGRERVVTYYDEALGKAVTMGNENIRGIGTWRTLFAAADLPIEENSVAFVRLLPPAAYGRSSGEAIARREQAIATPLLRKYFFFGVNFVARRP